MLSRRDFLKGAAKVGFALGFVAVAPRQALSSLGEVNVPLEQESFSLPQVHSSQREALTGPVAGQLQYRDDLMRFEVFDGTRWRYLCDSPINASEVQERWDELLGDDGVRESFDAVRPAYFQPTQRICPGVYSVGSGAQQRRCYIDAIE